MPKYSAKLVDDPSTPKAENAIRFMCLSDTHGAISQIPESTIHPADFCLFAGDMTLFGDPQHAEEAKQYILNLPVKHRIVISGNLDLPFDTKNYSHFKQWFAKFNYADGPEGVKKSFVLDDKITYLEHQAITIDNVKIFGSPYTPAFGDFGFPTTKDTAPSTWKELPADTDVLLCHGPPHMICDATTSGFHAGCPELRKAIEKVGPAFAVFGHIHEAHGHEMLNNTLCCNVAIVNAEREVAYGPTYIDLIPTSN